VLKPVIVAACVGRIVAASGSEELREFDSFIAERHLDDANASTEDAVE
jgi:hypothetical protein